MFLLCKNIESHPQRCSWLPFRDKLGKWSADYPQTLSQLDATLYSLAISIFAIYATPLGNHFVGSDWKFSGLFYAVTFSSLSPFLLNLYYETKNITNSPIEVEVKKESYEIELEKLKQKYYEKKRDNVPLGEDNTNPTIDTNSAAADEKSALQYHLARYKNFLHRAQQGSDLFKRVSLLIKGENENWIAKSIRIAQLCLFNIQLLNTKVEKSPDLLIWASFLDFELALKWHKKYKAPDLVTIFRSIYATRLSVNTNSNFTPSDPNTYSEFATLSKLPKLSLDMSNPIHTISLYQLISNNAHPTLGSLPQELSNLQHAISNRLNNQYLSEEADKTINLFKAKIQYLIEKEKEAGDDVLRNKKIDIYKAKCDLAQAKENQLLDKQKNITRTPSFYPKKTFKKTLYVSWSITALFFLIIPETTLPLSGTNRIAVWLLSAAVQQQAYLIINSKNYLNIFKKN